MLLHKALPSSTVLILAATAFASALPQKGGWPLTDEERAQVLLPEHLRRPGSEKRQHLPALWPVTPSAGHWGDARWLDTHARLVAHVAENKGPVDILLVGDSLTQQWGGVLNGQGPNAAWRRHFVRYKTVNIGIGGDKTQNVLWRLDHGGVDGLEPRLVILLIGNNNLFFTRETGIEPVALGIKACADNLLNRFPGTFLVVMKVLPSGKPGEAFHADVGRVNAALDRLGLGADPRVRVIDPGAEMMHPDGTLVRELFTPDNVHLTQEAGYGFLASRLRPVVDSLLEGRGR